MEPQANVEQPTRGGSYTLNADGTLTLAHCTAPAQMRDKRAEPGTEAAPETPASAPASEAGSAQE